LSGEFDIFIFYLLNHCNITGYSLDHWYEFLQ
jgi:hypothetical protein